MSVHSCARRLLQFASIVCPPVNYFLQVINGGWQELCA